jgi:hypothetical protein
MKVSATLDWEGEGLEVEEGERGRVRMKFNQEEGHGSKAGVQIWYHRVARRRNTANAMTFRPSNFLRACSRIIIDCSIPKGGVGDEKRRLRRPFHLCTHSHIYSTHIITHTERDTLTREVQIKKQRHSMASVRPPMFPTNKK